MEPPRAGSQSAARIWPLFFRRVPPEPPLDGSRPVRSLRPLALLVAYRHRFLHHPHLLAERVRASPRSVLLHALRAARRRPSAPLAIPVRSRSARRASILGGGNTCPVLVS